MMMKINSIKAAYLFSAVLILSSVLFAALPSHVKAAYNPNLLISDTVFTNNGAMSQSDVQNFLASKNSGLTSYKDTEDCGSPGGTHYSYYTNYYSCGQYVSAAKIIWDAAQAYQISPRTILATLQKEQSLVTTPNPTSSQLDCAMGYNSCGGFVGFFTQVDNGTWALKTYYELMNGRNWWGYTPSSYPCKSASSLYSAGLYPNNTVTFYNPGGSARTVTIGSSGTAALYCYTPYVGPYSETGYSGSYNFVYWFEQWWGSTTDPCGNPVINYGPGYRPSVNGDYTGDARTEATIFRPSDGCWHTRAVGDILFGQSGDIPVPGDYNGDGRTDIAVYRPSDGGWHIRGVGDFAYGRSTDIPVPADYNGDGRTDIAVYRPSDGTWHIRGVGDFQYGKPGDIPVPGDYNGDTITDIAVFRPSEGGWHIRGVGDFPYGQYGDIPVPGDYNGDRHTDVAIFRPSEGGWHIRGVGDFAYGRSTDIPVPGDYNGDGRTDAAIFRPVEGGWHIRAVGDFGYGKSTDIPAVQTLNAYLLYQYGLILGY